MEIVKVFPFGKRLARNSKSFIILVIHPARNEPTKINKYF